MKRGTQIAYVPRHADSITHPDVEFGFITSVKEGVVYCRYWRRERPGELRTVSNSEGTPIDCLVEHYSVGQSLVDELLEGM